MIGAFGSGIETLVFLASLPAWIVLAKIYGLYEQDEERTDHTTVDDLGGHPPPRHRRDVGVLHGLAG